MAGVTDLPFRLLCKEQGAGLLCMEMISAKALQYKNKNTKVLLAIHPQEYPVSLQLFGSDPKIISEQAKRIEDLPFLATDRSVLNLPAIGKSMTFRLVGITAEGKRILRFDHDRTRRHSPIIDSMGEIFIVENKSLAAYLRQLGKMGEDPEDYASIWAYTHGETEPRFGLYVYPDFGFATTDRVSNLELE